MSTVPYRAPMYVREAYLPSLGWMHRATLVGVVLFDIPSVLIVWDLLFDRDCQKRPTPHVALAGLVASLTLLSAVASMKLQREAAGLIARHVRVRSHATGVAITAFAVAIALTCSLVNLGAAIAVDFHATFRLCLDFSFLVGH